MTAEWKIQRRQGLCGACERAFEEGETLFSLLRFVGEDLERGDLCLSCFDRRDREDDVVFWRTTHAHRRAVLRVDFEQLLAALHALREDRRPERLDFCFLLALLLVRHRKLRLLTVRRKDGRELLVLRRPRSQKEFDVAVRELDPERRAQLAGAMTELLDPTRDGGLEALFAVPPADGDGA